jgi:epoxyqueuosine reductase QueG
MARFAAALDAAGLGLRAALPIARYDAAVPEPWRSAALHPRARSAVVIASGGRALWDAFARAPEFGAVADPLDAYTRRVTEAAAAELDASFAQRADERRPAGGAIALFAFERRGGVYADFVELGRLAGLGASSRLRLLLHPIYGPWMSLRALVLMGAEWEVGAPLAFDPCRDCPAPCAEASTPEAARRACVVGPEHVYGDAALAHHAHFSPGLRAR